MSRKTRTVITAAFIALLSASSALAQRAPIRSVLADYDKGRKAVERKSWDEAIAALTAAVAQDPADRAYVEGVNRDRYFPHHYLFIAYMEKGDVEKARQNWALRGNLPPDFFQQEVQYVARMNGGAGGATGAGGGTGTVVAGGGGTITPSVDRSVAPYNAALAALKASRWQDAITQLNNAIRIDGEDKPKADVPDGYFPHYYLAIANLRLNKLDEASAAFEKRGAVAKSIYLADEEAKFTKEVDFARFAPAGEDAFAKQQWPVAVDNLTKACNALPDECNNKGLRDKLASAQQTVQRNSAATEARNRITSAQQYVAQSNFDGAKREFRAALDRDPANAEATAGFNAIQKREKDYTDAKARGDAAQKANKLEDASRDYEAARMAHGQWFTRDKLDAVVASNKDTLMRTQGINSLVAEAQKAFDSGNFASAKQTAEIVLTRDAGNAAMKSLIPRAESRILFEEGRKMYAAQDFFQADAKYRAASDKDPTNDAAQKAFTQSSSYLGFVQQKAYAQAQKADPLRFGKEQPDKYFPVLDLIRQANENFANQNLGSASRQVDEALKLDPENKNAIGLRNRIETVRQAAKNAEKPVVAEPTATHTTAPLLPMWMWGAVAAVTLVGAGSILMVRGRTPMPVAIDALPWGRVSIQQNGKRAKAAPSEKTTPFSINLPPGEYELQVTGSSATEPYTTKVKVERGQTNKIVVTMPAYDVDDIVSHLLS